MKFTIALAALLGMTSVEEVQAITLYTVKGDVAYVQSDSSDDDEALV